jgi:hypothetical protein
MEMCCSVFALSTHTHTHARFLCLQYVQIFCDESINKVLCNKKRDDEGWGAGVQNYETPIMDDLE